MKPMTLTIGLMLLASAPSFADVGEYCADEVKTAAIALNQLAALKNPIAGSTAKVIKYKGFHLKEYAVKITYQDSEAHATYNVLVSEYDSPHANEKVGSCLVSSVSLVETSNDEPFVIP